MGDLRTRAVLAPMPPSREGLEATKRAVLKSYAFAPASFLVGVLLVWIFSSVGMTGLAGVSAVLAFAGVVGGFIVASQYAVRVQQLQRKLTIPEAFSSLGELAGKTSQDILAVAGIPTSVSAHPEGELLQWQTYGYHIALVFDAQGVCLGVSHEWAG